MSQNRNNTLDELLAALGRTPATDNQPNFPNVTTSIVPNVPAVAGRPLSEGASTVRASPPATAGGVTNNFNELVNLLGDAPPVQSTQPTAANRISSFPGAVAPNSSRTAAAAARINPSINPALAAQIRHRQQTAASKAQQIAALSGAGASRAAAAGIRRSPAPSSGIAQELEAVMVQSNANPTAPARHQVAPAGRPYPPGVSRPPTQRPSGSGRRPKDISQEQIIVGHFCRFAIKTMARITQGHPNAKHYEDRLKEHIKVVWAKWVRELITRPQLLDSVSIFVRRALPNAGPIDVIRDFKRWYEREYELQKQRAMKAEQARLEQARSGQPAGADASRQPHLSNGRTSGALPASSTAPRPPANAMAAATHAAGAGASAQLAGALGAGGKTVAGKSAQIRQQVPARNVPGKGAAGRGAGRGIKSVGGKSISRPVTIKQEASALTLARSVGRPMASGRGTPIGRSAGIGKSPSAGRGSPVAAKAANAGKMSPAGKTLMGGKGVTGNKTTTASKTKNQRKQAPKAPSKPSPKGLINKARPPPANPAAFQIPHGSPAANGKRPLEVSLGSPSGSVAKKQKQMVGKLPKGPLNKKKPPVMLASPPLIPKGKPPPARADLFRAQVTKRPMPHGTPAQGITMYKGMHPGQPAPSTAAPKKVKRSEDGLEALSALNDIVDIEDEEDKLGQDAGGLHGEVQEAYTYGADMLLAGPKLRKKMQKATRLHGLSDKISADVLELMSLAVRERLSDVIEGLKQVAAIRTERDKALWKTRLIGPNNYERLLNMRQDEERSLQVAAEMRVKRKRDQIEQEAKKLAGEVAKSEKNAKDSSAAAEAERKEKIALEKKKKEDSSQIDALNGLMRRRKKPGGGGRGLARLEPLGKKGLPPIQRRSDSGSMGSKSKSKGSLDPLAKLEPLGPLISLGRTTNPQSMSSRLPTLGPAKKTARMRLTLRDCLFYMKRDPRTRKGSQIFKWYPRLEANRPST